MIACALLHQVPTQPIVGLTSTRHNTSYIGGALAELHQEKVQYSTRLMASLRGRILSIDAGIKNTNKVRSSPCVPGGSPKACSAIHTILNEHKEVIGQYCGSNSTKELLPAFTKLRRRLDDKDPVRSGYH